MHEVRVAVFYSKGCDAPAVFGNQTTRALTRRLTFQYALRTATFVQASDLTIAKSLFSLTASPLIA